MTDISLLSLMAIDPNVVAALRVLAQVLPADGRSFVLIGAMVPQLLIDLRQGHGFSSRMTHDADTLVKVASWEDFHRLGRRLSEAGFRQGPAPHEFRLGEDVRLDLIPFGPGLVKEDRLVWPKTEIEMSTLGIEEAFECAKSEELAPGLSLPVVPIPGLVLLKIVAYQDRPEERKRDLTDVVFCFEHYEEVLEGSRRFDLTGVTVDGHPVQFEEAGAYLLGIDVAKLARPKSLVAVRKFLDMFSDEYARPISQILTEERRLADNEGRRRELSRLFMVFATALREGTSESYRSDLSIQGFPEAEHREREDNRPESDQREDVGPEVVDSNPFQDDAADDPEVVRERNDRRQILGRHGHPLDGKEEAREIDRWQEREERKLHRLGYGLGRGGDVNSDSKSPPHED